MYVERNIIVVVLIQPHKLARLLYRAHGVDRAEKSVFDKLCQVLHLRKGLTQHNLSSRKLNLQEKVPYESAPRALGLL
jgi:hypothetical protein